MEDILASIRRIIADDNAPEAEPEAAPPPAPKPRLDDVLDLAQVAKPVRRPQPVAFDPPEIEFDIDEVDFSTPEPEPVPVAPPPPPQSSAPERLQAAVEEQVVERLVSKTTDDSVGQHFTMLAHTVLTNNARTLEDLVKDMLRPMLKSWLDDNLPTMVERLVRAEIERVARGR
ncbi:DUF2497 domain-containing protein [Methylobacterium sp. WL9]|uniref:DUF2497 domain-containing protein n=2 Tax=Methylobacterium thuringiense TaxID=1003091 RepID=A0ABQ4TL26_9HYPH|nr:DUF2497 domain-containing protein [Methylobacterium sp. WL9]TXN25158.1 DUF2497 domain-containing protein [Methylobacterium sp. WL9]GJE54772.1 hypothetical protein EKPJFOCH_1254 [Methylobacterium thuringiense]